MSEIMGQCHSRKLSEIATEYVSTFLRKVKEVNRRPMGPGHVIRQRGGSYH